AAVADAADHHCQLADRAVGVARELPELAGQVGVGAAAEVAVGDRAEQLADLVDAVVCAFHQGVEAVDHLAVHELEARGLATAAEVAGHGGVDQRLDLAVDRKHAGLDLVHRLGDAGPLPGPPLDVPGQVAAAIRIEHRTPPTPQLDVRAN